MVQSTIRTSIEELLVLIAERVQRFGEGGGRRHGVMAEGPEAGVEDGNLESPLAVEGGTHGQIHHLLTHLLGEREEGGKTEREGGGGRGGGKDEQWTPSKICFMSASKSHRLQASPPSPQNFLESHCDCA